MHNNSKRAAKTSIPPPCLLKIGDQGCTGCSTCANACPQNAIEIRLNREGFYRPSLSPESCSDCGFCLKTCPVILADSPERSSKLNIPKVYAAWSTDPEVHRTSSSGGVFSELARHTLDQGGVVCGCEWGPDWTPSHVMVDEWKNIGRLRGSKYIPSFIGEQFYRRIIEKAESGTPVLFCGTPCQVAGLSLLAPPSAGKNMLLVDLVCHGVPSLVSFWKYLDWKFGSRSNVEHFSFRNKEISIQTICARTKNGSKYLASAGGDAWFKTAMVYHYVLQFSCFRCKFSSCPRPGDITLGDYWGIPEQWHDLMGDSVVLTNSTRGQNVLNCLLNKRLLKIEESELSAAQRKIGRLSGSNYDLPLFRRAAINLTSANRSFAWVYYLNYKPANFHKRLYSYIHRRSRRLLGHFQHLWTASS